jgi:MFS transporter, PPP family, 3-phenylpropionic acid transporter
MRIAPIPFSFNNSPVLPLSIFWFLSFSGFGIFYPFLALYLHENAQLDGAQTGLVMAMPPLIGIIAQPLWGYAADRTGARLSMLALVTAGTAIGFAALAAAVGFVAILMLTALLAIFLSAIVPLAMSVTFAALRGQGPHAFGLVRVWGTIGYLLSVAGYPWVLHRFAPATADGFEPGLPSMFVAAAACTALAAVSVRWLPAGEAVTVRAMPGQWRVLMHERALVRLLLFTLGGYIFLQGPMSLFPIYVRAHGGGVDTVGHMWVVMLLLEMPLIALSGTGLQRLGARGLLAIGVLAGGVRWTTCALTDDLALIYVAQLLHGAVVTGLLLGGPMYLEQVVPDRLRSTAQGILAMVSVGVGGIISNAATGWLLDRSSITLPYLLGGIGALILGAATAIILPVPRKAEAASG